MQRPLIGLTLAVLGLIAADRLSGRDNPDAAPIAPPVEVTPQPAPPPPTVKLATRPVQTPAPAVDTGQEDEDGGSIIAKLARLEGKRRIAFAGDATYLDSLFITPDSMVRRWPDSRILRVWTVETKVNGIDRAVERSLDQWTDSEVGLRFEQAAGEAGADIVIELVERLDSLAAESDSTQPERAGVTDVKSKRDGEIVSARIRIAMLDRKGKAYTVDQLETVILHEFGHALGLPHSPDEADIMFPVVKVRNLSIHDRSSVRLLYSLPTGPLREPVGSQ